MQKTAVILATAFLMILSFAYNAAAESEGVGWVTEVTGNAYLTHEGVRSMASAGSEVFAGDEILTGAQSSATIQLEDDSILTVGERGQLIVSSLEYDEDEKKNSSYFKLISGQVRGLLNNLFGNKSEMAIETSTSIAGIKGSDISVWIEGDETTAAVNEGTGYIRSTDKKFPGMSVLKAGKMLKAKKNNPLGKMEDIPPHVKERIHKLKVERKHSLIKKLRKDKQRRLKELNKEKPKEKIKDKKAGKKEKDDDLSAEEKEKRKELLKELKKRKKENPYN